MNNPYTIDVDVLLKGRRIPAPAVWLLKRMLHVDFINAYLSQGREGIDFCRGAMEYLDIKLEIEGLEDFVPEPGKKYTIASNHPLGGIDGVALGAVFGEMFGGKMQFLVNSFLMYLKGIAPLSIPVNKLGGQARNMPVLIDEAFKSENQMMIFPAGICSRKTDGIIQDPAWTKTFIKKSVETGRDIIPVHFYARNSARFYFLAKLRKFLGIKFNFEMFTLPDEMYRQRHGTFRVVVGKPIPCSTFDSSKTDLQWAQWVREKVYSL